ncbi:MAG: 4Fe-4S binding protein [Nitrososphaerales archaeon]|nr:4Fe-4S binding protein [Nitrososphaerales archaeon]
MDCRSIRLKVFVDEKLCKGCRICINVCPYHIFVVKDEVKGIVAPIDQDKCTQCGICELYCPDFAIAVIPKKKDE